MSSSLTSRPPEEAGSLTDVPGLQVGHASLEKAATGITVILCERGATCGLEIRGGASGLRNPTVARPGHLTPAVHAVFFAGGSAFGLDAGAGVMRYLEERGVGYPLRGQRIPIVTGAILFDLAVGHGSRRPDPRLAQEACRRASGRPVAEGSVGAGTGATIGKISGYGRAMKGGLGSASMKCGRLRVGALAVVNAFGDVRDPWNGSLLAGARTTAVGYHLLDTEKYLRDGRAPRPCVESTTLALVATNARLSQEATCRLASVAHVALARCLSPAHTCYDGDLVYALSTGSLHADPIRVESLAVEALSRAILRGVLRARGWPGIPGWRDLRKSRPRPGKPRSS